VVKIITILTRKQKAILINHYMLFVSTPLKVVVIIHRGDVLRVMYVGSFLFYFFCFIFLPKPEHSKSIVVNCIPPRTKTNVLVENATTLANSWLN